MEDLLGVVAQGERGREEGERGREERERSTDVNYWVLLSGSPTEPVAMATYSGCGPLWGGLGAKNCREASWKQQCEFGPRLSVFLESFLV